MALSQLQCLDENHVNPRILESKPEFLYCEEQRLALEALLRDGREAFVKFLEARGLRGFLSDPEQETLTGEVEPYDPGSDLCLVDGDDDEPPLSLQYWPDLSDTSVPQMDLGWPDCAAYRGVTRTNVYAQPPLDGRVHIKEIVRKTIAQAQKVIAVVMDVFTDVDIFRDLLDAGFKRRVSVYILLERTALPHFLSMCQRANMHAGHLKNLRVRCAGGVEFYSRSCSRVQGRLGHRFMFIDGDKAVSGSYSFTWMSSRLDKHLITVVTGQAVDAFDSLFRNLYMTSSTVDLRQIATDTQPEPEPLPQPAAVALPSADLARKLYSPKYALVAVGNASLSPTSSPKDSTSQNPELPETKKGRRSKAIKEAAKEAPPLHPGLANLEKAYLIPYLPTWPEPDPPSDVIGFINIRDANRPTQVHLQRSERFETSQAIRFSSPFSRPEETLPEVAQPRQFTAQCGETRKVQPTPGNTKPETSDIKPEQKAQTSGPNTPTPEPKLIYTSTHTSASEPETETLRNEGNTPALNTEHNLSPNTPTSHDATPQQSSATAATVNPTHTVTTHTPKPEPLPVSDKNHTGQTEPSLNTHTADMSRKHTLGSNNAQTSNQASSHVNTGLNTHNTTHSVHQLNTEQHALTRNMLDLQSPPQSPSKKNTSVPTPTHNHIASSSAPPVHSVSSTSPPPENTPITTAPTALLPTTSTPSPSTPPVPKPRTVQLVIKSSGSSDGLDLPEVSVVRRPGCLASARPLTGHNETRGPDTVTQAEKEANTAPELQNKSGTKTGVQTDIEKNSRKSGSGCSVAQQTQSVSTQEVELEELQNETAQSDILITNTTQTDSVKMMPKKVETQTVTLPDHSITTKPPADCVSTARPLTGCESTEAPNADSENVTQPKTTLAAAKESQRISCHVSKPQNKGQLGSVDSDTHAHKHNSACGTHISKDRVYGNTHTSTSDTHAQQSQPSVTSTHNTHDGPPRHTDTAKHSTHDTFQDGLKSPEVKGRLCLHFPDSTTNAPDTHTPVSLTHTPDPRSCTPDVRTPLSDVSDGYLSPREGSTLSTTSEEYYECSDELVFDRGVYHNPWTAEDSNGITHKNSATITSPACRNTSISYATEYSSTGRSTSSSETGSLSGASTATRVSLSSLLEKILKEDGETNEKSRQGKEEEERRNMSVAENSYRTERAETERASALSQEMESQLSLETKRTANHVTKGRRTSEAPLAVGKDKEDKLQAPNRKRTLDLSIPEEPVASKTKTEDLTNKGTERERPEEVSSGPERERPEEVSTGPERERPEEVSSGPERERPEEVSSGPERERPEELSSGPEREKPEEVSSGPERERPEEVSSGPERERPEEVSSGPERERPEEVSSGPERERPEEVSSGPERERPEEVSSGPERERPEEVSSGPERERPEEVSSGPERERPESVSSGPERERPEEVSSGPERERPEEVSSGPEREGPEEVSSGPERVAEAAALGPGGVEKRDRPPAARETEGKKPMRTPPRAPRGHHHQQQQQQQDSKAAPQSRPSQIPAGRPRGSRPSKVAQSSLQVLDNTSSACRLPPSPAPPKPAAVGVGGVGRRQSEVSPSQHSSPFSQPPAAQGRARAGQTQSQPNYPKPQASFLYTHSHLQSQLMSSQNQTDTQAQPGARQSSGPGEAPRQEEGKAFGVSFSRLYKLKGLKDRMSQPPQQSKRSSTVSPAQGHKSTG